MSIVSTSNRWLNRLYKAIAIFVVLLAVLISGVRLLLPYAHHYKYGETDIQIGKLNMGWQGLGPTLLIEDVKVLDNNQATFNIDDLHLEVDFWRSLYERRLISSNLILSGAKITVDLEQVRSANDADNPNELVEETDQNTDEDFNALANTFLKRIHRFSLINTEIQVSDQVGTRQFHINQLNWLNTESRHQAQGTVVEIGRAHV